MKIILTLFSIVLLSACGDTKINELRGEFIEGCKSSKILGSSECKCIFKKYQEKYSREQLLNMNRGIMPSDISEFTAASTMQCVE